MKNKKYLLFLLILPLIVIMVGRSFAANFDREIKSIEFTSSEYPEAGGFHIEKSAKWIEYGKAQVTFDIESVMDLGDDYKDVILVIDVSGSMGGEKIAKVKKDAAEMVDLLLSDSHNRVALVEFETSSYLELEFTNDKERVLDKINHMYIYDSTNYNAALQDVDRIMKNYVKEPDRSVTLMFLTDGYPNIDIDNQIATYHLLKEKYPYMEINGVQYEMGNRIVKAIRDISDNQWSAFIQTLHNVLFDASLSPKRFSNFVLTDYIDNEYFYLESVDDIEVNMGTVRLDVEDGTQKITWDLSNEMTTVSKPKMTINLSLKDKYVGKGGFFPTNKKETVVAKLLDKEEKINSNDTPVLSSQYNVIYDTNTPEGCSVNNIESEKRYPFKNVAKKNISLHCDGYNFRGWIFDSEDDVDITHINDDVFIMPGHDVRIVAIWDKITPVKSMSGEVKQNANTLFDIMRMSAVPDDRPSQYVTGENGIDFTQEASDTNGRGVYELRSSMVVSDAENVPIYYFRGTVDNTFVLFAGYCWQIVRTMPDKGVKLIYYGEPTGTNHDQCNSSTRYIYFNQNSDSHLWSNYDAYVTYPPGSGYISKDPLSTEKIEYSKKVGLPTGHALNVRRVYGDDYWYADSYEYDENTKLYKLVNPVMMHSYQPSAQYHKYTLFSEDKDATGDTINYVVGHDGPYDDALVFFPLIEDTPPSAVNNAIVGSGLTQNSDGTYTLTDTTTLNLQNFNDNINNINHKYMCPDYSGQCKEPRYVAAVWKSNCNSYSCYSSYYIYINYNEYIIVSNEFNANTNTLSNMRRIRLYDFYLNNEYSSYKYSCLNNCSSPSDIIYIISRYVSTGYSGSSYTYNYNYKYGKSITWDGSKYHLVDVIDFTTLNNSSLQTHHYTCKNEKTVCDEVYYLVGETTAIKLSNGAIDPFKVWFDQIKNVEVDENKNPINGAYNSPSKNLLEDWYETNLMDYSQYLDDAVWCYNRDVPEYDKERNFLSGNGFNRVQYRGYYLQDMGGYYTPEIKNHPVLKCYDKRDAYTINDIVHGNGLLKYSIALLSGDEYILGSITNRANYIGEGQTYWYTFTPAFLDTYGEGVLFQDGSSLWSYGNVARRIKPSIVLKPSIPVKSGNGTKDNPYQLDLD